MSSVARRQVLFLCFHNSARSQMAEGWLRFLGGRAFVAASAGTSSKAIRPEAIEVMRTPGIDLGTLGPKSFSDPKRFVRDDGHRLR